ncbi:MULTISPECIES: DUF2218 domain-containing protein [Sphingopyxis]|jgi:hypothetical protein|uniref:DUF2218 domain-containing protein n=1 Tax=Sphingopyxis alaskensis (strain DSM 13593 / LMG 18877 / RB2256) TaxID=317655 RepID=Q1GWZ3_SPHAL|nr:MULTISPECIES: DUF2218 domain-containing protein [Sphingopyxis]MBN8842114.1 DUF2218 domain-containing protein [Sphingomonadales bacterium]MBY0521209.1 DUF2218 domain-containing protein [Sphingomonas sp.]MCA0209365.1 DUF2218 domain-containing protein [Pseudomonadota bacterium]ABF51829.1 conserved hypothetical protein [Sphingopyxis alaskensis RB2256]ENY81146.1 hypothetical protein EBMC1_10740 [Sphingopyxis sp. MC1]
MIEAEARIATIESSRYLTRLAEAWVHTYPVRYDALTAEIQLPGGELILTADGDSLSLRLVGKDRERFDATKQSVATLVDRVAEHDTGVRCVWNDIS